MSVLQVDGTPVALRECFVPLNPDWFSPAMLVAMDKFVPSALGSVPTGTKVIIIQVISDRLDIIFLFTLEIIQ